MLARELDVGLASAAYATLFLQRRCRQALYESGNICWRHGRHWHVRQRRQNLIIIGTDFPALKAALHGQQSFGLQTGLSGSGGELVSPGGAPDAFGHRKLECVMKTTVMIAIIIVTLWRLCNASTLG